MKYRDLGFMLLGAVIVLAVIQVSAFRANEHGRVVLGFENDTGRDVSVFVGDGASVRAVDGLPQDGAGTYLELWDGKSPHEGTVYSIGWEVDGRRHVVNLNRAQLQVANIGDLHLFENGDVMLHLGGEGSMPAVRTLGVRK